MITKQDIEKDLRDWKNGKMGYNALLDAIETYAAKNDKRNERIIRKLEDSLAQINRISKP